MTPLAILLEFIKNLDMKEYIVENGYANLTKTIRIRINNRFLEFGFDSNTGILLWKDSECFYCQDY